MRTQSLAQTLLVCVALGVPGSQVILACVEGVMAGSVAVPGRGQSQIEYAGPGLHRVNDVDPGRRPPCGLELGSTLKTIDGRKHNATPSADFVPRIIGWFFAHPKP